MRSCPTVALTSSNCVFRAASEIRSDWPGCTSGSSSFTHFRHSPMIALSPRRMCSPTKRGESPPAAPPPEAPPASWDPASLASASAATTFMSTGAAARWMRWRTRQSGPADSPAPALSWRRAGLGSAVGPRVLRTKSAAKARTTLGETKASEPCGVNIVSRAMPVGLVCLCRSHALSRCSRSMALVASPSSTASENRGNEAPPRRKPRQRTAAGSQPLSLRRDGVAGPPRGQGPLCQQARPAGRGGEEDAPSNASEAAEASEVVEASEAVGAAASGIPREPPRSARPGREAAGVKTRASL